MVAAGGDTTFFVLESPQVCEVYSVGLGLNGQLGNSTVSQFTWLLLKITKRKTKNKQKKYRKSKKENENLRQQNKKISQNQKKKTKI